MCGDLGCLPGLPEDGSLRQRCTLHIPLHEWCLKVAKELDQKRIRVLMDEEQKKGKKRKLRLCGCEERVRWLLILRLQASLGA